MCQYKEVGNIVFISENKISINAYSIGKINYRMTIAKQDLNVAWKQNLTIHSVYPCLKIENHRNCKYNREVKYKRNKKVNIQCSFEVSIILHIVIQIK